MSDILIILLSSLGTIFILLAGIGILRMPDFYMRASISTKAVTLGVGLLLAAVAVAFDEFAMTSRVIAIILFIVLTAPVAAHMIGRAAYFVGVEMWKYSVRDDLKDKYDKKTHQLKSEDQKHDKDSV